MWTAITVMNSLCFFGLGYLLVSHPKVESGELVNSYDAKMAAGVYLFCTLLGLGNILLALRLNQAP